MNGRSSPAAPTGDRPDITAPGARPAGASTAGCARCHHPFALHSNGASPCKAFACSAGVCEACQGTKLDAFGGECAVCDGKGAGACPEFVSQADGEPEQRLLAS